MHKRIVGLAFGVAALVGCAPPEALPEDLYGLWANEEAGTWRVFEFEASSDAFLNPNFVGAVQAYQVFVYEAGAEPEVVQWGTFAIAQDYYFQVDEAYARSLDNVLITSASGSADGALGTYANPIFALGEGSLTMYSESAPGHRRTFARRSELP